VADAFQSGCFSQRRDNGSMSIDRVAEGVWQLTGYPPSFVNCYLVGEVLIDCATRWARSRLLRDLRGRRLSMIALTHCHPDH
jgi:hydroxyacylglutathione hydrolase